MARRYGEANAFQNRPARIIAEFHVLEADFGRCHGEGTGARFVGDFDIDPKQGKHRFHIDQRLPDFAIDEAQEIQG